MATGLPTFSEFDVNDTSRQAERLNKLLSRFQNLLVTMISIDKKWQRALLLHYASEATYELFLHGINYNCFLVIRRACHLLTLIRPETDTEISVNANPIGFVSDRKCTRKLRKDLS